MKYLNLSEEEFQRIFSKYNADNFKEQRSEKYGIYYYIPPELSFYDYKKTTRILAGQGGWVNWSKFKVTIKLVSGFTDQEYYDMMVLHINDSDLRPKCSCGKPRAYYGTMKGYYNCCSKSCASRERYESGVSPLVSVNNEGGTWTYIKNHADQYQEVLERQKEFLESGGAGRMVWDRLDDHGVFNLNCATAKGTARMRITKSSNRGFFYIVVDDSLLKIGLSIYDPRESRVPWILSKFTAPYSIMIYEGSVELADLEYEIKINHYNELAGSDRISTEFFSSSILDDVLEIVKKYPVNLIYKN